MIRTLFLLLVLVVIGALAALNWPAFVAPTTLSLGVTTVQAPLGMLMLGAIAVLTVLFAVWALSLQSSLLMEQRRQSRELQAQRELADKAEASRFTELRAAMSAELLRIHGAHDESRKAVLERIDRLEEVMRRSLQDTGNTLSAYIGELEDRLEGGRLPSELPAPPLR